MKRMMSCIPGAFLIAQSLLSLCLLVGCDGQTVVSGIITDQDGKPLSGALVRMHQVDCPERVCTVEENTNKTGAFKGGMMHSPVSTKFSVTATKDGYEGGEAIVKSNEPSGLCIIKLRIKP